VFELDLKHCPNSDGELKIIPAILEHTTMGGSTLTAAAGTRPA
jgi:hypothetical protein